MTHTRKNRGTCSVKTTATLGPDGTIERIEVEDGCSGNLQGVCRLLQGQNAREAISLIEDIRCGRKGTSCPHQISLCLREALDKL